MKLNTQHYPVVLVSWGSQTAPDQIDAFIDDFEFLIGEAVKREDRIFLVHDLRSVHEIDTLIWKPLSRWLRAMRDDLAQILALNIHVGKNPMLQLGAGARTNAPKTADAGPVVDSMSQALQMIQSTGMERGIRLPPTLPALSQIPIPTH
jgi:hypothetical protein